MTVHWTLLKSDPESTSESANMNRMAIDSLLNHEDETPSSAASQFALRQLPAAADRPFSDLTHVLRLPSVREWFTTAPSRQSLHRYSTGLTPSPTLSHASNHSRPAELVQTPPTPPMLTPPPNEEPCFQSPIGHLAQQHQQLPRPVDQSCSLHFEEAKESRGARLAYSEEAVHFLWFCKVDLEMNWSEIQKAYQRQFPHEERSSLQGLQCKYYRVREGERIPSERRRAKGIAGRTGNALRQRRPECVYPWMEDLARRKFDPMEAHSRLWPSPTAAYYE